MQLLIARRHLTGYDELARPNFFIVGAPKCGTTALSEYLRDHPAIFITDPKEPNFFDPEFHYYSGRDPNSVDDYLRFYDDASEAHLAIGESSVWYLYSTEAARRIAAFDARSRIIIMVRNPIELVHSLHSQLLYTMDEDIRDFETAWDLQGVRRKGERIPKTCRQPAFLQYGAIASFDAQIERYYDQFPAEQILTILFDDFRSDTAACYRNVLEFLGVPDDQRSTFEQINENRTHRSRLVSRFTQRPPRLILALNDFIKARLGIERHGLLETLRSANRQPVARAPMSAETRCRLAEYFAADINKLEERLGRNLQHWVSD